MSDGNKSEITFVDDLGCIELPVPNGNAAGVTVILIVDIHQNDIYIYIYIPGTQMTLVLVGKGLVLGG